MAISQGPKHRRNGSHAVVLLLNLCHPQDTDASAEHALSLCIERVQKRGLAHHSLVPGQVVDIEGVVETTIDDAEGISEEEKGRYGLVADLDMTQPATEVVAAALEHLQCIEGCLPEDQKQMPPHPKLVSAVRAARNHELSLTGGWATHFWGVELEWQVLLWGEHPNTQGLRKALAGALQGGGGACLEPLQHPHVTLLFLGGAEAQGEDMQIDERLETLEGATVTVTVNMLCVDQTRGLVCLGVSLLDSSGAPVPCANHHPHITVAKRRGVKSDQSNLMLAQMSAGLTSVVQTNLEPVPVSGAMCRTFTKRVAAAQGTKRKRDGDS